MKNPPNQSKQQHLIDKQKNLFRSNSKSKHLSVESISRIQKLKYDNSLNPHSGAQ